MNNQPVYRKNQIQTLILLLKALELKSHKDNFFELVLFLARYSFLFENPQNSVNSCTSEVPQIYTEQAFSDWSMKYVDPTGMNIDDWQDNGDGTWTVKSEGATLWDVYGADWKEKSGFEGDPTKLHIGDTVGKKNTSTHSDAPADVKQQILQSNAQNANGLNTITVEKKQSTLSSWWSKKAGEKLTDEEKNLQKGIGIGEMIAGPTLGTLGCAQTGGQSVLYGYYVMADGAVMVAKSEEGVKAIPGAFFLNLLCPVAGTVNGVPVVVEYNMSPLSAGRYR